MTSSSENLLREALGSAKSWIYISVFAGIILLFAFVLEAYSLASVLDAFAFSTLTSDFFYHYLFLAFIGILFYAAAFFFKAYAGQRAATAAKTYFYHHALFPQDPMQTFAATPLNSQFFFHVQATQNYYSDYLPQKYLAVIIPFLIFLMVLPINWLIAVLFFLTFPLIPLFMYLIGMGAKAVHLKHFEQLRQLSMQFNDALKGMTVIRLFGKQRDYHHILNQSNKAFREKTMAVLRIAFLSSAVLEFFSMLAIALMATYLGLGLLQHFHIGYVIKKPDLKYALFLLMLAPEFYMPLRQFAQSYHAKQEALAAVELIDWQQPSKLKKTIDLEDKSTKADLESTVLSANTVDLDLTAPAIRFDNLSLSYGEAPPLFESLSFDLPAGKILALLGESGAGKTSILHCLLRFLSAKNGSILINEANLTSLELNSWYASLAYLPQVPRLFYGTLASNLRLAKPTATLEEMEQACAAVGLNAFVAAHPLGLERPIGEQLAGVSGGEAHRIALARFYLKPATLWILDEPTAHLDKMAVQQVQDFLVKNMQEKTVILATHRPETAALADYILNL